MESEHGSSLRSARAAVIGSVKCAKGQSVLDNTTCCTLQSPISQEQREGAFDPEYPGSDAQKDFKERYPAADVFTPNNNSGHCLRPILT